MLNKILLLITFILTLIVSAGCTKKEEGVDLMLASLNTVKISDNDAKISSTEPTFKIEKNVPTEKKRFGFDPMFSDNMVLQANAGIHVYGTFDTDGDIAIELNGQTFYSEINDHKFSFYLGHYTYGGPYEMIVYTRSSKYVFTNVMIGEVFLMSGQSNMAITLSQILKSASPTYTSKINKDVLGIVDDQIRFITVGMAGSSEPMEAFHSYQTYPWEILSSDNALGLSATAFYYAKELKEQYDISIGVIISAVGATNTNTWIPIQDAVGMDQTYIKNISDADTPSRYYNGMIHPLKQFTFRGVVWYQGEGQHVSYEDNMTRLIHGWRREFDSPNLKFLIVELPRFDYELGYTQDSWFSVRQQQQALTKIDGVSYSVNIDLGISANETNDPIHPFDKDRVGSRAAHAFMDAVYDAPGLWSAPKLIYVGYVSGKLILKFSNVGEGLYLTSKKAGFEISVDGNRFSYVEPILVDKNTIELNTSLESIQVIRYGYTYHVPEVFGPTGIPSILSELVCVYNSGDYPLDQFTSFL